MSIAIFPFAIIRVSAALQWTARCAVNVFCPAVIAKEKFAFAGGVIL